MTKLAFSVIGVPQTQGHKKALRNPHTGFTTIVDSNDRTLWPWRDSVAVAAYDARMAAGFDTVEGPVLVEITFYLERAPSTAKKVRLPWKGKDVDTLARAVLDSLTDAKVYATDSRVTDLIVRKRFGLEHLGAHIVVSTIDESEFDLQVLPTPVQVQTLFDVPPVSVDVGAL